MRTRLPNRRVVGGLHAVRAVHRRSDLSRREQQRHVARDPEHEGPHAAQDGEATHQVVPEHEPRAHVHGGLQVPLRGAGASECEA